jgi:hypothetical protein
LRNNMKNIFDELLAGWAKAIDGVGLPEEYRKEVVVVRYRPIFLSFFSSALISKQKYVLLNSHT